MGRDNLTFLDGYLYRIMVQILRAEGPETSGFYDYYRARVEEVGSALSHYDRILFDYVQAHFDRKSRHILHAGTGLGTLPSALALAGYRVAGVEQDGLRFQAAGRIHAALAEAWPTAAKRYQLIQGEYPTVVNNTAWLTPRTVLIFTNCGATWPEDLFQRVLVSLSSCGDVVLDARLFGDVRNTPEERQKLVQQIETHDLEATPIAESPSDAFYYHLRPRRVVE
jgi:hypothetical protein